MSKSMNEMAEEMKNNFITISEYEMSEIIASEISRLLDHEKMEAAGLDNVVLNALFAKVLAMFGAAVMTEMFAGCHDKKLEIEPNDE